MNSRRRLFFSILGVMRRRLWAARAISLFYAILPAAAIALLTWVVISRWIIIVHLDIKMIVTSGMAVLVWLAAIWYRRPSWTDAARSFDKHGLDDRVTTALGFLDDDSSMAELQRDDTLNAMRHALPGVKRKKIRWFYRKRAACALVLFGAVWLGLAFPNDVMKQAAQAEQEQRIVEKKKEAVSEFVDQQKGEVRPKAKKELSRLKKKVAKTEKAEDLMDQLLEAEQKLGRLKKEAAENQNTLQRLEKKLENQNLQGLAQALRQRDLAALKQQMQAIMEKIDGVSDKEKQELLQALQNAAEAAGQKGKISDDPQQSLAALQKQLAKMIKSAGGLQALANAQQQLQHLAKGLNQQMIAAGLAPSGALAFGGNGSLPMGVGQPGSKNGNSSKGGSGSKGGKGSGSGSGTGSGSGFGSGSGSGSGSGGRSGSGSGTGPGSGGGTGGSGSGKGGNGAGFGQGGRNMLTVPENLNGKRNREVDTGELGEGRSEKQIAPGSPILPGQLRPYEEVYGHYETTYRQSMERMDLPEHLQSIVKNYFSDLAPDQ